MPRFFFRHILFFLLLDLSSMKAGGQNLVPNPSFEDTVICPNGLGQISRTKFWFSPTSGTPDYFNSCFDSIFAWTNIMDVPNNFVGYQPARTGYAYCGFLTFIYNPNAREYIEIKLDTSLIANTVYYISFFVSRSDSCIWAVNSIGAYLSKDTISQSSWSPLPYPPQILSPLNFFLQLSPIWEKISGTYIAQGGENFLTIGNFNDDLNTDTLRVAGGNPTVQGFKYSYYYIDDVCLSTDSNVCNSLNFVSNVNKLEPIFYPNPTSGKIKLKNLPFNRYFSIKVYSLYGYLLNFYQISNIKYFEIDMSNYSSGMYVVELRNQDGTLLQVKKINLIK